MTANIVFKKKPNIEIRLLENGFQIKDGQTERNTGFYLYNDLKSIELNNAWFPRLASVLRIITWIFNGVPYFPDADSYKKSNIIFHLQKAKHGIWLTDPQMAKKAKMLKELLDEKTKHNPE